MATTEEEQGSLFDREKLALLLLLRPAILAAQEEPDPAVRRTEYLAAIQDMSPWLQELAGWALLLFSLRTGTELADAEIRASDVTQAFFAARETLLKVLETVESGGTPNPEVAAEDAVTMSFRVAQESAVAQAGTTVTARRWKTQEDHRVRPAHEEADNQIVLGLDATYTVGGESARYPGDPHLSPELRINCRCYEQFQVKGLWV